MTHVHKLINGTNLSVTNWRQKNLAICWHYSAKFLGFVSRALCSRIKEWSILQRLRWIHIWREGLAINYTSYFIIFCELVRSINLHLSPMTWIVLLWPRPGSDAELHMNRTNWQFGSTRKIENACLSQTPIFTWAEPKLLHVLHQTNNKSGLSGQWFSRQS